jgi:broad specificity phosphatase PhoE
VKTIVGLLRHGQTDWNIDMRLQGISDIPMNDYGRQQAETAAKVLAGQDWDKIVSSPLSRAVETAEIVAKYLAAPYVGQHPLLLERSFGIAEGMGYEEWRTEYPNGLNAPEAESMEELTARCWTLLDALVSEHPGQRVLTVSHGALIRRLIHLVSNGEFPREGERFGNASMTVIEHVEGTWSIRSYEPKPLS